MKKKGTLYVKVWFVAIVLFLTMAIGGATIYASGLYAEWTGQNEIAEITQIAQTMVIQINEADVEIALLEVDIADLENDAIILQAQLDTLLAQSGSKTQEIADLTAELAALQIAQDALQLDLDAMTAERDQLTLDLQAMTDERDWLAAELATANADMVQFKTDICTQVDQIASDNKRAAYDTWCGVRP